MSNKPEYTARDVFEEGQWWLAELDSIVANGTQTQKRAMAVVRNLLSCWQRTQPAQAGEREAFDEAVSTIDPSEVERLDGIREGWDAYAAWQRTQAAGVPEVTRELAALAWQRAHDEGDDSGVDFSLRVARHVAQLLAAAPAHPAAQEPEKPFMFAVLVGGQRTAEGSEARCKEWAEAWNDAKPEQAAVVVPLWQTSVQASLVAEYWKEQYQALRRDWESHIAAHDQPEVQRLREALALCRNEAVTTLQNASHFEDAPNALVRIVRVANDALTASTRQEE